MNFPAYGNEEGVNSLIREIQKLNADLNIPKSFKETGVNEQEFMAKIDLLADRAFEDQCTTANPRLPLVEELKQILSEKRYIHSIGVMEMAMELAQIYNIDIETAQIAGLLHDNAKEMTDDEMLQYVKENNIQISETEKNSVKLLHGKIGADIAKKKYGVSEEIAKAIEYHTTTNPNMDTLAKIIYVSDKIELNRKTEKYDIEAERKLAKEDLDKAMLLIIKDVTKYLIEQGKLIAIESIETRNKLLLNIKGEN